MSCRVMLGHFAIDAKAQLCAVPFRSIQLEPFTKEPIWCFAMSTCESVTAWPELRIYELQGPVNLCTRLGIQNLCQKFVER